MKTIISLLLGLSYILCGASASAQDTAGVPLDLGPARVTPLKVRAAGIVYAGVEASAGDVCTHVEGVELGGRTFNWSDAQMDGLFVEDRLAGASKIYQPYVLARRAGWHVGGDEPEPNNNIWGLFVSGGRVWMGTNGLGVLAFDPRREEWTRYDWQTKADPGVRTELVFIDGRHMFVNRGGGVFVYSLTKGVGIKLPFAGDGSGEVRLTDGNTYAIEFAGYGYGRKGYTLGVTQLEGYFAKVAPVRRRRARRRPAPDGLRRPGAGDGRPFKPSLRTTSD